MNDSISSNLEDYLEAILLLVRQGGQAHAADIARHLKVTRASVTGALHALAERGLVDYKPYRAVTLTPEGDRLARQVSERHAVLHRFFGDILGVPEAEAETAACRMEHAASGLALERLIDFVRHVNGQGRGSLGWQPPAGPDATAPDIPTAVPRGK
jgi:DtxR family Mn-dependent transcriptional regulator